MTLFSSQVLLSPFQQSSLTSKKCIWASDVSKTIRSNWLLVFDSWSEWIAVQIIVQFPLFLVGLENGPAGPMESEEGHVGKPRAFRSTSLCSHVLSLSPHSHQQKHFTFVFRFPVAVSKACLTEGKAVSHVV